MRLDTQNPDVLYLRARVFYGQGENAKAIAHCMEALRCDPDFAKARNLVKMARAIEAKKEAGNAAFKSNRLQEAYDEYTSALDIDPENAAMNSKLYSNRAAVLQKVCIDRRFCASHARFGRFLKAYVYYLSAEKI